MHTRRGFSAQVDVSAWIPGQTIILDFGEPNKVRQETSSWGLFYQWLRVGNILSVAVRPPIHCPLIASAFMPCSASAVSVVAPPRTDGAANVALGCRLLFTACTPPDPLRAARADRRPNAPKQEGRRRCACSHVM